MFKPRQEAFTSEDGNKYTFQSVLPSVWAGILDRITDKHGKMLNAKVIPEMLNQIVVQPSGLKMDDFEEFAELQEVTMAAYQFQQRRKSDTVQSTDSEGDAQEVS